MGINESGKTNILHALSLLDPRRSPNPNDLRDFLPDENPSQEAFVRFVFALDRNERIANYKEALPKVLAKDPSTPVIERHGKQLSLAQFFDSCNEGLYTVNIRNRQGARLVGSCRTATGQLTAGKSLTSSAPRHTKSLGLMAPPLL